MGKIKYIQVKPSHELKESELNIYGQKGWQLISAYKDGKSYVYIFSKACDEDEDAKDVSIEQLYNDGLISLRLRNVIVGSCRIKSISELRNQYEKVCHNINGGSIRNCGKKTKSEFVNFVKLYQLS